MRDVGAWLEQHGFSQYAELFETNDIDFDVLVELTEDDLRELSISFGHRKKMLRAIAEHNRSAAPATPSPAPKPAAVSEFPAGERRLVTILFCDLVGSTAMTAQADDPEDMFELISAYHAACSEVIERFGGYVARLVGDGVLAYFGYPKAKEGEAERAVRSALALRDAVQTLGRQQGIDLAVRIGIDSGMVIIGDLVWQGNAEEDTAVGDTPNLAARLQGLATPGQIVFSENTKRLVGSLFDVTDLGIHELKGFSAPLRVYLAENEADQSSGLGPDGPPDDLAVVGREAELNSLQEAWSAAADGDGKVVFISGEPGIGKSNLLRNFRTGIASETSAILMYECSPFYTNSAFHVVASQVARSAGMQRSDTPAERLTKLENVMIPGVDPREAVPLLGFLCSVPTDHRYPRLDLPPAARKQAILTMLMRQLDALCSAGPVLMLVEDAQWIDPSSSELLTHCIERAANLPLLIVVSYRTGEEPSWIDGVDATQLNLARLTGEAAKTIINKVAGQQLPPALQSQIVEKSDGVPLFVEELTKSIVEAGLSADGKPRWQEGKSLPEFMIPATLHDSLMARLDRLNSVKDVVQFASVLGRSFAADVLSAMVGGEAGYVERALEELVEAELLYKRGQGADMVFVFRHALLQETTYAGMLRGRRQRYHRQAAVALSELHPNLADRNPEVLAYHWSEAGEFEHAYKFAVAAGEQALARYANKEARVRFRDAIDAASRLDYGIRMEANAMIRLAQAPGDRESTQEDLEDLAAIRSAVEELSDGPLLASIDYCAGQLNYILGDFESAIGHGTQSYERAETVSGGARVAADAGNLLARIHAIQGAPRLAIRFARRNAAQMAALDDKLEQAEITSVLAFSYAVNGQFDQAIAAADEGLRLSGSVEHLPTKAAAYFHRGVVLGWRGEIEEAEPDFEQALALSHEANDPFRIYMTLGWRGQAMLQANELAAAEADLRRCLVMAEELGTDFHRGAFLAFLAALELRRGSPAADVAGEAVGISAGRQWAKSIAMRVHAESLAESDPARAVETLNFALALQQNRECWYDAAWTNLAAARLYRNAGSAPEFEKALTAANEAFETMGISPGIAQTAELASI